MANRLTRDQLVKLARLGAASRLEELKTEIEAIESLLGGGGIGRRGRPRRLGGAEGAGGSRRRSGRRRWSAAQRRAAAERMRNYWAKRKAGSKK